jgi:hypothetical protein
LDSFGLKITPSLFTMVSSSYWLHAAIGVTRLFDDYKALADSGDAGNWKLEETPEGK